MQKRINIDEVKSFIMAQSAETKIYIGGDSERVHLKEGWLIDFTLAIVVHIDGNHGCKIFDEVQREADMQWDKKSKPRMRLMKEVYKIAELYLQLADVLEDRDDEVQLDINPSEMHGSSGVINEADGYIRAMCNVVPMVKPRAFAALYAADRLKEVLTTQRNCLTGR